jgi:hypothetical protein
MAGMREIAELEVQNLEPSALGCELIMALISPVLDDLVEQASEEDWCQMYAGMIGAIYGEAVSRMGYEPASVMLTQSLKVAQTMPKELFSRGRH